MLENDDALATEATGDEDDNGTWLERWTGLGWTDGFANLDLKLAEFQLPLFCIGSWDLEVYTDI